MPEYAARVEVGELPVVRGVTFVGDDVARKQVIDALMCFLEVDLAAVRAAHGLPADYFGAELAALSGGRFSHIVAVKNEYVRVTSPHRMAARVVAAEFDAYRGGITAGRYSKVA
jgi:oxygen-independent coproporphyrinogen-3 oxidase